MYHSTRPAPGLKSNSAADALSGTGNSTHGALSMPAVPVQIMPVQLQDGGDPDSGGARQLKTAAAPGISGDGVVQRQLYVAGKQFKRTAKLGEAIDLAKTLSPKHWDKIIAKLKALRNDTISKERDFATMNALITRIWEAIRPLVETAPQTPAEEPADETAESEVALAPAEAGAVVDGGSIDEAVVTDDDAVAEVTAPEAEPPVESAVAETTGEQVTGPQPVATGPAKAPEMNREDLTHVGFEIEIGQTYDFPLSAWDTLEALVNQTLVKCTVDGKGTILEMLLDDIKKTGRKATAQVEFRTTPLDFSAITSDLGTVVRAAIAGFPVSILSSPEKKEFTLPAVDRVRRKGKWEPTAKLTANAAALGGAASSAIRFRHTGDLAQHATTSIELEAFTKLHPREQELLYSAGKNATSKQGLLDKISGQASGKIDATTVGRNSKVNMVKTPVESIMAADDSLAAPESAKEAGSVKLTAKPEDEHALGDVNETVTDIRESGAYPSMQGHNGKGYRAVAEKMQAPLQDSVSEGVRVLVEHRSGGLRDAINEALSGNGGKLLAIARAAGKMDDARGK